MANILGSLEYKPSIQLDQLGHLGRLMPIEHTDDVSDEEKGFWDSVGAEVLEAFQSIYQHLRDNPDTELSEDLKAQSMQAISKHFLDLLFLELQGAQQGISKLADLFLADDPIVWPLDILSDHEPRWTEVLPYLEQLGYEDIKTGKWFELFQSVRTRWMSDLIDAYALESINILNKHLIDKKEVVLLFSDAPTMTRALNWHLIDMTPPKVEDKPRGIISAITGAKSPFDSDYHLLRTPRTFLTLLRCIDDDREFDHPDIILNRVRAKKAEVDHYFSVAASIVSDFKGVADMDYINTIDEASLREEALKQLWHGVGVCRFFQRRSGDLVVTDENVCLDCPYREIQEPLTENLQQHENIIKDFDNVSLYANKERFMKEVEKPDHKRLKKLCTEDIHNIFVGMTRAIFEGNSKELEKTIDERHQRLNVELSNLNERVPSSMILSSSDEIFRMLLYRYDRFVRIFGRLQFETAEIGEAFDCMQKAFEDINGAGTDSTDSREALSQLWEISKQNPESSPESSLLYGALAYINDQVDACLDAIRRAISRGVTINAFGYQYLYTLASHTWGIMLREREAVNEAMKAAKNMTINIAYAEDPRTHHLYGLLCFRALDEWADYPVNLKDVVNTLDHALELGPDCDLEVVIANNILYGLYSFDKDGRVLQRRFDDLVAVMESNLPHEKWSRSYLDTVACATHRLSTIETGSKAEKMETRALEYINRCLDLAKDWKYPLRKQLLYQQHMKKIAN